MTTYKLFAAAVRPELAALRAQIDELRDQLAGLAHGTGDDGAAALAVELRRLIVAARGTYDRALGGDAGIAELRATVRDARAAIGELRATLDLLAPRAAALADHVGRIRGHVAGAAPIERAQHVLAVARAALDKIDPLLATLDQLSDRIARGEGTLGRLMADPEFSDDAKDLGKIIKRHPWRVIFR